MVDSERMKIQNSAFLSVTIIALFSISHALNDKKVILMVFDGLRHDFFQHYHMPNLLYLSKLGVRAERMIPSFPTTTWSTLTTLGTGVYPEIHGVLGNEFYDPLLNRTFHVLRDGEHPQAVLRTTIFVDVLLQGGKFITEDNTEINNTIAADNLDKMFTKMMAPNSGINLGFFYHQQPDFTGHLFGPESQKYRTETSEVDRIVVGRLLENLKRYPDVNIVIASDHGFAHSPEGTSERFIDDYLQNGTYQLFTEYAFAALWPRGGATAEELKAKLAPLEATGGFQVLLKNQIPDHLHIKNSYRTPPIVIIPKPGWLIVDTRSNPARAWHGNHGYDNSLKIMHAVFVAHGPAFYPGIVLRPFESVNVYPLLAHLLGVTASPGNGSLTTFCDALYGEFSLRLHGSTHHCPIPRYCNGIPFNPRTHFCRFGKIALKCAGRRYNPWSQACCGRRVYRIWSSQCLDEKIIYGCVGKYFNPDTSFCRYDKVAPYCNLQRKRKYNPWTAACCGKRIYNTWSGTCTKK